MISALDVAKYFLSLAEEDAGDLISNLKLQKLVYYAQGFSLAILDRPLFPEEIQAWAHGPVVPALYHEFKNFGSGPIELEPDSIDFSLFSTEEKDLLDEVYSVLGQFSAWKLRNMTHDEPPWKETLNGCVISHDKMKAYFKTQLFE